MKSVVERQKFINQVEQILHVPGNYTGGILEMAVVIDCALSKEAVKEELSEYLNWLKHHSPVFANVRFNVVFWKSDDCITTQVTSLSLLQIGRPLQDMPVSSKKGKSLVPLMEYLKKFHARSKLILFLLSMDFPFQGRNIPTEHISAPLSEALQPFLHRKILFLNPLQIPEQSE